jgi:hypothetical protein
MRNLMRAFLIMIAVLIFMPTVSFAVGQNTGGTTKHTLTAATGKKKQQRKKHRKHLKRHHGQKQGVGAAQPGK